MKFFRHGSTQINTAFSMAHYYIGAEMNSKMTDKMAGLKATSRQERFNPGAPAPMCRDPVIKLNRDGAQTAWLQ